MALNIKSDEADELARELSRRRRTSITRVVIDALRAELDRERRRARPAGTAQQLLAIADCYAAIPDRPEAAGQSDEALLGYTDMTDQ